MSVSVCYNDFLEWESNRGIVLMDWQKQYAQEYFQDRAGKPMRRWMTARGIGRTLIMNELAFFVAQNTKYTVSMVTPEEAQQFNEVVIINGEVDRVSVGVDASKLLGNHDLIKGVA